MVCKNCGEQLEEGTKFCTKCGARVDAGANINAGMSGIDTSGTQYAAPFSSGEAAVKTHKSVIPVIIAIVAVIAVAGVVAVFALTGNSSKAGSMSPQEYFRYVGTKSLDESTGSTSAVYKGYYDYLHGDAFVNQNMTINFGEPVQNLVKSYTGIDVSWLKSVSVSCDNSIDGGGMSLDGKIGLNGVDVLDFDTAISTADQAILVRLPSISDAYLASALNTAGSFDPAVFTKMADMLPDQQRINNIVKRYGEIVINDITKVEKTTADMTAGSVTQSCTKVDAVIDAETAKKLAGDIASAVKNDNDLTVIIDSFITALNGAGGMTSSDVMNEISKSLENMASSSDTSGNSIVYTIYTDNNDVIVGTEINASDGNGSTVPVVKLLAPKSGGSSALDFEMYMGQLNLSLTGTGNGSDTSHSGTYTLALNYDNLLTIDVENYNIKALSQGEVNGAFTVKLADGAMDMIRNASPSISSFARLLEDYSIKFNVASSGANTDYTMSLVDKNSDTLLSFEVKSDINSGTKSSVALPSGSDTVYNASDSSQATQYLSGLKLDSVINALKQANVPSQYTDLLSAYAGQLSQLR